MSVSTGTIKFSVTGLTISYQFQQCQYIVNQLHQYYPEKYIEPQIRPMLNIDWEEYLLKVRRLYGKGLWKLKSPAAVFMNGEFFGDSQTLIDYVTELYSLTLNEDFAALGEKQLLKYFENMYSIGRNFTYLIISINENIIGTLVVMLYSDLVPACSGLFLNRCKRNILVSAEVSLVRVVPKSWLQFKALKPIHHAVCPCENYAVPHDRRGIVSLYKYDNKSLSATEFLITLDPTPWMDHFCVAFGQVIQGEETLRILENVPVENEIPTQKVEIVSTNRLVLSQERPQETYIRSRTTPETYYQQEEEVGYDVASVVAPKPFREGLYCLPTDLRSYRPFLHLPDYLLAYLKNNMPEEVEEALVAVQHPIEEEEEAVEESEEDSALSLPLFTDMKNVRVSKAFVVRSKDDLIARMSVGTLPTMTKPDDQ